MNIFVNATAADTGGLFTIVDQFISSISLYDKKNKYYVFVSVDKFNKYCNGQVNIIKVNKKKWTKRFIWDAIGMKKWARKNCIYPEKIISLQNTPVNYKGVKQIIYLHTPIPFSNYNWNLLKKDQRKLWFYKHIYPIFIKMFLNEQCKIIVQTAWVRSALHKKFKISKEQIKVIKPNMELLQIKRNMPKTKSNNITLFYPARGFVYKNHETIIKALKIIKDLNYSYYKNLRVYFTVDQNSKIYNLAKKYKVDDVIEYLGLIPYEKVLDLYQQADCVLFPSYLETFGLPLIEAASFGKKILCADEEYSREVIGNYEGVEFIESKNENKWAKKILHLEKTQLEFQKYYVKNNDGWQKFFEYINKL